MREEYIAWEQRCDKFIELDERSQINTLSAQRILCYFMLCKIMSYHVKFSQ